MLSSPKISSASLSVLTEVSGLHLHPNNILNTFAFSVCWKEIAGMLTLLEIGDLLQFLDLFLAADKELLYK